MSNIFKAALIFVAPAANPTLNTSLGRCFPNQPASLTSPAPGDRYTRGVLTDRPRVFSLFMALTYAMTSPTWPL